MNNSEFKCGLKDGIPIAMGYFAVSFSFGIVAVKSGLTAVQSVLTSLFNLTSAGQFAGIGIIATGGTILEMILTQFIINLRYALMSVSVSQKLADNVSFWKRLVIAFGNTDEIFAVAMNHNKELTLRYMVGLELLPIIGWSGGTAVGALANNILPSSVCTALGVALYGMFVAVVVPKARKSKAVAVVVLAALVLSCAIYYIPVLKKISTGIAVIICTVAASAFGAILFPVTEEKEGAEDK